MSIRPVFFCFDAKGSLLKFVQAFWETPCILRTLENEVRRALFLSNWAGQRSVMQCVMTIAPVRYYLWDMIACDTHSRFWNMHYERVDRTETAALSWSWKKTPIGLPASVSKVYFTFCGAAVKLRARVTVCWGS